jgi:hypothetical protein
MLVPDVSVEAFKRGIEEGDGHLVASACAAEFEFHHQGSEQPTTSHEVVRRIVPLVRQAMGDEFEFTHRLRGDVYEALVWRARIDEHEAEGVDLLRVDADGKLTEIRITMRPIHAIRAFGEAMARLDQRTSLHD